MMLGEEHPHQSPGTDATSPDFPGQDGFLPSRTMGCMRWTCYVLGSLFLLLAAVLLVGGLTGHVPRRWGKLWKYAALAGAGLLFVGRSGYRDDWR